jgi:hypothetical protein
MDTAEAIAAGDKLKGFDREKRATALFFFAEAARQWDHRALPSKDDRPADPAASGDDVIEHMVHKVTWTQVGGVTEPGRYLFTFGWLTIAEADLAVWTQFPEAAFTLVSQAAAEAVDEFRLGAFTL